MAEGRSSSFVQPAIPRFDGHYDHWVMLMENFLRSKEYWDLIENVILVVANGIEPTKAQHKLIEEQKLKDLKVKNYLFQAIDREVLETIIKRDTEKYLRFNEAKISMFNQDKKRLNCKLYAKILRFFK